jgi:hypothetical protein
MPQQAQVTSQVVFGPASNGGGDIVHYINANANSNNGQGLVSFVDKNGLVGGVQGVANSLANGSSLPANLTAAAAGANIFSTSFVNLPANSAYEGVPFTVKAAGWVTLNGGTYTATIQPLIYGSTAIGFTASAAAAVCSSTAINLTIAVAAAATLTTFPWEAELTLVGGTGTGIVGGSSVVRTSSGAIRPAPNSDASANSPTGIVFNTATTPLNFLPGVTIGGATVSASVVSLSAFYIES